MSCRRNGFRKQITEAKKGPWSLGERKVKGKGKAPGGTDGDRKGTVLVLRERAHRVLCSKGF